VSFGTGEGAQQPRRPASRRRCTATGAREGVRTVPWDGRRLGPGNSRPALTCSRRAVTRVNGSGSRAERLAKRARSLEKGRQRITIDRAPASRKSPGSLPRNAPSARGRRSDRSRQARRQARSCWRPDDREVVRRDPRAERWQHRSSSRIDLRSRRRVGERREVLFLTPPAGSLQRWYRRRVLVT
jgi:hypothetical protein